MKLKKELWKNGNVVLRKHAENGVHITTYGFLRRNIKNISKIKWDTIILDEGHEIKNPLTKIADAVKQIDTPNRIILSGTPIQNNLKELWALFDFAVPGLLGSYDGFSFQFFRPIEYGMRSARGFTRSDAEQRQKDLNTLIDPYFLQRRKADVLDKSHVVKRYIVLCPLSREQEHLYEDILRSREVTEVICKERNPLRALTALRKISNHPDLFLRPIEINKKEEIMSFFEKRSRDHADLIKKDIMLPEDERSGKLNALCSMIYGWRNDGRRVAVFSQTKQMLNIVEATFRNKSIKYLRIDGDTSEGLRQRNVDDFNRDKTIDVLLLTTRTGGQGLNLFGATIIVILDPDWNPAMDRQAAERSSRIGQREEVSVYRFISAGTVEEQILCRQKFKEVISYSVLVDPKTKTSISFSTLNDLFSYRPETETVTIIEDNEKWETNFEPKEQQQQQQQ